jgi:putative hydrolase of the HAD superfamily
MSMCGRIESARHSSRGLRRARSSHLVRTFFAGGLELRTVRAVFFDLDGTLVALGVLTNGGARGQRRRLAVHDLIHCFEAVVVSAEIGAGKPDPEIFAAARDAIPADEPVFVADDLDRDVRPAQREGSRAAT